MATTELIEKTFIMLEITFPEHFTFRPSMSSFLQTSLALVLRREKSKEGAEVNLKGGLSVNCLHSYSIHPESTISIE